MKRLFFIIVFMFISAVAFTQIKPEEFIGMLPPIPGDVCNANPDVTAKFFSDVNSLSYKIKEEEKRRQKEINAKSKSNEQQIQTNMMKQSGMSQADIQQMQAIQESKKNGGNEQKEKINAMMDAMMQQKNNISLDEIKNAQKMDPNARKAWATAYGTEMKAEMQANPEKYQQQNTKALSNNKLADAAKNLADSLTAVQSKFDRQFEDLEIEKETDLQKMSPMIKQWQEEASKLGEGQRMDELTAKVRNEGISFCNKFSPKYNKILSQYETFTKSSIEPLYRLEELQSQLTLAQTGVNTDVKPGLPGIKQIQAYLNKLSIVYTYGIKSYSYTLH